MALHSETLSRLSKNRKFLLASIRSGGRKPRVNDSKPNRRVGKTAPGPVIMDLPYHERVMHLLAMRPYPKPELISRLEKDGIPEKDRDSLESILETMATLSDDGKYHLKDDLYPQVRVDWPGYRDVDRQLLRRQLLKHLSTGSHDSSGESHKRPASENRVQPTSKCPRTAHVQKDVRSSIKPLPSSDAGRAENQSSGESHKRPASEDIVQPTSKRPRTAHVNKDVRSSIKPLPSSSSGRAENRQEETKQKPRKQPTSHKENHKVITTTLQERKFLTISHQALAELHCWPEGKSAESHEAAEDENHQVITTTTMHETKPQLLPATDVSELKSSLKFTLIKLKDKPDCWRINKV